MNSTVEKLLQLACSCQSYRRNKSEWHLFVPRGVDYVDHLLTCQSVSCVIECCTSWLAG